MGISCLRIEDGRFLNDGMQNREMTKQFSAFDKMTGLLFSHFLPHSSFSNTSLIYFVILHSFIYRLP